MIIWGPEIKIKGFYFEKNWNFAEFFYIEGRQT